MNRTTLRTLCVAGFVLTAASCSSGGTSGNSGGAVARGGAGGAGGGAGGAGGAAGGAGGVAAALTPDAFGQKFKFSTNELAGWQQAPDADAFWTGAGADDLHGKIDGPGDVYIDNGYRVAMFQTLAGPGDQTCQIVAMDFGTVTQANAIFTWKVSDATADIAIPPYDISTAAAFSTLTGITVYAYFKQWYFEVLLSGYGDQSTTCSACPVAAQFLNVLKAKAN